MAKIIVSIDRSVTDDKRCSIGKRIADFLGVSADDVLVLFPGVSVSVVEVPDVVKTREKKHDAEATHKPHEHPKSTK